MPQDDKSSAQRSQTKPDKPRFTRGPVVDNVEMVVMAVVLALTIRCFLVEAFEIPTGSMAPTLYGQYVSARCPECSYNFAVAVGSDQYTHRPIFPYFQFCPNCGHKFEGYRPTPWGSPWGGDRLLVNKVIWRFQKPQRWDPFVFVYPHINDPVKTIFIKRLIGLPGDNLEIIRGDIVVNGEIQRKTPSAQSQLWMLVYDSRWPWHELVDGRARPRPTWLVKSDAPWKESDGSLSVDARSSSTPTYAHFAGHCGDRKIFDNYGYDAGQGQNVVTDVRFRTRVAVEGSGTLELILPEDDTNLRLVLAASGSDHKSEILLGDISLGTIDYRLPASIPVRLELTRVDYLITASADGKEIFRHDLWTKELYDRLAQQGRAGILAKHTVSGVGIGAAGIRADFTSFRMDRDVYYGASAEIFNSQEWRDFHPFPTVIAHRDYLGPIHLPDDQYMALGDNSPASSDSRYWGIVPGENVVGLPLVVWWSPTRVRLIH